MKTSETEKGQEHRFGTDRLTVRQIGQASPSELLKVGLGPNKTNVVQSKSGKIVTIEILDYLGTLW